MAIGKGSIGKVVVWIVLGLLIVALGGFGTANFGGSAQRVASVGDSDVTIDTYARAYQNELRAFESQINSAITVQQAEQFGLSSRVLAQLTAQAALDGETERLGLSIGDDVLRAELLKMEAFTGLDGVFDPELYRQALNRVNLNERDFEQSLREDNARALLTGALATGLTMPQSYGEVVVKWLAEERNISVATLTSADLIGGTPIAGEADIQAHYDANPAPYTAPETRKVTYAWMTPSMIADQVELNEDVIRALYDENIDSYMQPERRLVERLVFGDAAEAEAAMLRITSGEASFEDEIIARGLSLIDADMGDVSRADLDGAGAQVFAADINTVTGPIDTDLGPALFRVNGILDGVETTFEEARPEIVAAMATDAAARQISGELEAIDDLLAAGATIEELADETDMQLGTLDWTDASEGGIAAYSAFVQAVVAAQPDDFPEVLELSDGGIFALRLDEIQAPALRPLDEVKDQVAADWEAAQIQNALKEKAAALESEVAAGAALSDLGLLSEKFTALTRRDFIDTMPDGFIDAVFAPGLNQGGTTLIEGDNRIVIAKIDSVSAPANSEEHSAIAETYNVQAAQGVAQDVISAFTRALQEREGITVNEAAINAVHAQLH